MTWWSNMASSRSAADRLLARLLACAALAAAGVLLLIVTFVLLEAWPAIRRLGLLPFLTDDVWQPTAAGQPQFGVWALAAGSLAVTAGAMLLAAPIALLSALFQCYYAPTWLAMPFRRLVELLNGVPSVVFGYWGLVALAPLIDRWQPPGQSLLAGMLVVGLMIAPTMTLTAQAALRATPADHFRSAAALGLGRWAVIWHVCLPAARRGIAAGAVLAAARAAGETMAVVMVCGNVVQVPESLFDPVRTITANIALEMGYAVSSHRSALFVTGLLLIVLVAAAMAVVELLTRRKEPHA